MLSKRQAGDPSVWCSTSVASPMSFSTLAPFTCFMTPIASMRSIQSRRSRYPRRPPPSIRGRVSIAMRYSFWGKTILELVRADPCNGMGARPPLEQAFLNAELIQRALDGVVDDVVHRLRPMVERGHWREDD